MVVLPNHRGNLFIPVKSSFSPSACSVTTLPITNTPTSGSLATAIHSPSQLPYQFNPAAGYNLQNLTFSILAIVLAAASLLVSYPHLSHEKRRRSQTRRTQDSETGSLHELSSGPASQSNHTYISSAETHTDMNSETIRSALGHRDAKYSRGWHRTSECSERTC